MRALLCALIAAVLLALALGPSLGVEPEEQLRDPALEARAREISAGLRCLVCQNESIDDSSAALAHDLRLLVRQRLQKGDTNKQAVDYIVARYGEFVLLKPRLNGHTLLLWLAPALLLAGGLALASRLMRRQAAVPRTAPLSAEEQQELEALLDGEQSRRER